MVNYYSNSNGPKVYRTLKDYISKRKNSIQYYRIKRVHFFFNSDHIYILYVIVLYFLLSKSIFYMLIFL